MHGVFSIAPHMVRRHWPDVVTDARTYEIFTGSVLAVIILCLFASDQRRAIQESILDTGENRFRAKRNTFQ
jgi:hypothetical protein